MSLERHPEIIRRQGGFTLTEVIVVMSIIAIAAAIGIPSMRGFLTGTSVTSATNDLVSAINLGRSEAVTRGSTVSVCKSSTYTQAVPSCDTSGNGWQIGWIVFADRNGNGAVDDDNGDGDLLDEDDDTLLRVYQAQEGVAIQWSDAALHQLTYAGTGFLTAAANPGTLEVVAGGKQINIELNAMGRVRSFRP